MRKQPRFIPRLLFILLAAPAFGQDQAKPFTVSLEDCIVRALKSNIGVAIQVLNPEIATTSLQKAQEKFIPTLTMDGRSQSSENASYSFLDAADRILDRTTNMSFSASQAVPLGGTMQVTLSGYRTATNRTGTTINPRYSSTLRFNFSQPLLRNFGWDLSRREILIARNSLQVSEYQLKKTLMDTIYNVETAYWNLVYSIENLKVRQQSLDLARDLLEKNKRSVEIGTLAPMEVVSAQAEVATRDADIIQAETQVRNNEDQLKALINLSREEEKAFGSILPQDTPESAERKLGLDEALAMALQNRPDLEVTKLGIQTEQLNVSYARNQILPDLSVSASLSSPGISGTQLFFLGNPIDGILDPDRPPVVQGISPALKDTFGFKYNNNWSLGLTLSVPLGNVLTKATYVQAKLNMRQAMLELENQQQQVFVEIKSAVRSVEANYRRINAYRAARELAEQKLAAEEEKLKVGLSTNYLVLSYQRDLANARISELNAIIAYNVSLAGLDRSVGVSLKNRNIKFTEYLPE